ncbi:MAG: xanthine dehydrogenase family protein molybdopterin-binding subunit [Dehalococcoidia bacterium]|nr:xanthine dehydrogenase family protein molybdopterin-binding subunit [Dehalococcoidia bacterium]
MTEEYSVVGKRFPRLDGPVKVTGQASFAGDLELPRMLEGKILRSPFPHARIVRIDTSRALGLSGVKAVVTAQDTLQLKYNVLRFKPSFADEYMLALDKVRYVGDAVAAVAAVDGDTAEEALDLIQVEYEELPAVFDPEEALKPGAPRIHDHAENNISRMIKLDFGDVDGLMASAYHVREDTFVTQTQSHTPLEGHACVASYDADGRLTVWTSTQNPYYIKKDLAYTLGLDDSKVRVILPYVGGGFGGKADGLTTLDFASSLLSMKCGRPVRIVYGREEEFIGTRRRHPLIIWMKTGVDREGRIVARDVRCIMDGGGYNSFGPASILLAGIFLSLPYRYQSFRYRGTRAFTNKPPGAGMRGHTAPQGHFASDTQLDMIAQEIGMDPLEIRLRNALKAGETTATGFKILSSNFDGCIHEVASKSNWAEKRGRLGPNRGIGIGCSGFPSGSGFRQRPDIPTYSSAMVRVNEDGTVSVLSGAVDTGQGSDTVLLQIAAEELGANPDQVKFVRADTDVTPVDLGNFASRTTVFAGNAVKGAASEVKKQVFLVAADELEANPGDLVASNGFIYVKGTPDRKVAFTHAGKKAIERNMGRPVVGEASYDPPDKLNYSTYSFGAQVAEVEVDPQTGRVEVIRLTGAHDGGTAINPMGVEGQLEGSMHMALGLTLTEEVFWDEGRITNASLTSYCVPSALDMPRTELVPVDSWDPEGPFGAKESGEGTVGPTAPAIANAIFDAAGIRMKSLPITAEKVLVALEEKSSRQGN